MARLRGLNRAEVRFAKPFDKLRTNGDCEFALANKKIIFHPCGQRDNFSSVGGELVEPPQTRSFDRLRMTGVESVRGELRPLVESLDKIGLVEPNFRMIGMLYNSMSAYSWSQHFQRNRSQED